MQLFRKINNKLTNQKNRHAATIGNFDGMHLGHQKVLEKVKAYSSLKNLPSLAIIFEPQPMEFFLGASAPSRLTTLREKTSFFRDFGIDKILCLRFNKALANISAPEFIQNILLDKLKVQYLAFGDDFSFGYNRAGGFELLQKYAASGLRSEKVPSQMVRGIKISSTHIRQALAIGDLRLAKRLLGRAYSISGKVAHGDGRGRELGFPTANIYLRHKVLPLQGVFAVRITGIGKQPIKGIANVGNRPTFGGNRNLLEVHLLSFNKNIYGERIYVEFLKKIRDEKKFDSLELLKQQIGQDIRTILCKTTKKH